MRLAFRLGYWGENFFGSQVQADVRTVEGEVIAVCRKIGLFEDARAARFAFAGRTDRGVNAAGQVCAFSTDEPERAVAALRFELPADIWTTGWAAVHEGFSPRKEARSRTYRYYFSDEPGDVPAMDAAAQEFVGEHDFTLFSRQSERSPIRRVISACVREEGGFCVLEVTAESFLWNMVRCIAWTLAAVGRGEMGREEIRALLEGRGERRVPAARPEGLILTGVDYGFAFTPLPPSPKATSALDARLEEFRLKERVNRALLGLNEDLQRG
jgi:tRNA pseudouridine38-40 synthase